jgi:hypothetical protein
MTPSAAVAEFGGRRYHRFIPFNFFLSLAAPHLHGVLVLVTGNKFIAGVVVTSEKLFSCVNDTGDKFIAGDVDTSDKFIPGINDARDH